MRRLHAWLLVVAGLLPSAITPSLLGYHQATIGNLAALAACIMLAALLADLHAILARLPPHSANLQKRGKRRRGR